jgi:hypothetical protein
MKPRKIRQMKADDKSILQTHKDEVDYVLKVTPVRRASFGWWSATFRLGNGGISYVIDGYYMVLNTEERYINITYYKYTEFDRFSFLKLLLDGKFDWM